VNISNSYSSYPVVSVLVIVRIKKSY